MADKKVKVLLAGAVTFGGADYPAGVQELPEAAAKAVLKKKLGTRVDGESEAAAGGGEQAADFTPLSVEETMERFGKMDFADEVMKSMQFHRDEISERFGPPRGASKSGGGGTSTAGGFPEDFPGFEVLGQVEGMSPEKLAGMSDEEILKIKGIGPATLKEIRAYGK